MKDINERKELLESSLIMKRNVCHCLMRGKREAIIGEGQDTYGAPVLKDEVVLIPTAALERYSGRSVDASVVLKDKKGREYGAVPMTDIPEALGLKYDYDDMGLIVISPEGDLINRKNDLDLMMSLMMRFIFDYSTPEEIYSRAKQHTCGFSHPYLLSNADTFARLRAVYYAKEGDPCCDNVLRGYISALLERYEKTYEKYALCTDDGGYSQYVGMKPENIPVNPNTSEDGYDVGGRLGVPAGNLVHFAFSYQITGDDKYAKLAYDYSLALGKWDHWGPGHFLNCADSTAPFSIALDWLYNAYVELSKKDSYYSVETIEDICFTHGVELGYLASTEIMCPWPSTRVGNGGFVYHKKKNNWNAVCTSGMTLGAFAIMGNEKYADKAAALVSDGLYHLAHHGLGQYAPDGSYIESPGYWCYGTNTLFRMIAALLSATGSDFGYLDTWGLDTTCYFAVNAESSDFRAWSYHDGGTGYLDTSWFNFVAEATGDEALRPIRRAQIEAGKSVEYQDVLYYRPAGDGNELPLSYYMQGIDGFAARSSWERGALFTGIIGAGNWVPHGQMDAGAFVYHNKGRIWIHDMGSDNYNVHAYWGQPYYYRRNAEGNNDICLVGRDDVPFGQIREGTGTITAVGDNGSSAYAVMDTVTAFGNHARKADRGMLLTNGRTVAVVQDELCFHEKEEAYWFAHYDKKEICSVEISDDGRSLFMVATGNDEKTHTLRLSIVGDDSLRFALTTCYDFVLPATYRPGTSESLGGRPEHSREEFGRIAIHLEGKSSYSFAVVFEMVDEERDAPVSYKWRELSGWNTL